MPKGIKRTATTITLMTILAIVILTAYFYLINRTEPLHNSGANLTEVQKMMDKDLKTYYPATPKEVVKVFAGMIKVLYNNPKDADSKALALKIRELYDQEFINANPEDAYLKSVSDDLAKWSNKGRKITNYFSVNEDLESESEIDGIKYATEYVEFTIQEHSKFTEVWNVLLRQDVDGKWKILGWEPLSGESNDNKSE